MQNRGYNIDPLAIVNLLDLSACMRYIPIHADISFLNPPNTVKNSDYK